MLSVDILGYTRWGERDLSRERRLVWALQFAGAVALLGWGWLFYHVAVWARPALVSAGLSFADLVVREPAGSLQLKLPLVWLLSVLVATPLVVLLHEGVHGLCFWAFSRRTPRFGLTWFGAYAALAEGVAISRGRYVIVLLAPLVILTLVSGLLLVVVPIWLVPGLVCFAVLNAAGAVGDLYLTAWLLRAPRHALVADVSLATVVFCRDMHRP
jgi:hypothetical protein